MYFFPVSWQMRDIILALYLKGCKEKNFSLHMHQFSKKFFSIASSFFLI
jgi:hypothetical protein